MRTDTAEIPIVEPAVAVDDCGEFLGVYFWEQHEQHVWFQHRSELNAFVERMRREGLAVRAYRLLEVI